MTVQLTIDGQAVTVPKGTTVYNAAIKVGIDLPIFCYQDRMPPFGACRVCLVEVENMPKLQTSCTLIATEGMVVKTQTQKAVDGRTGIIEFLLINHPLDCPICDRGGECPLQEHTLTYGPGLSRFFEEKRHFVKPVPLGPVLMLDRERCIICARCTRFGELIAGDHALEFIERGYKTEVGTPHGAPAESKFIGNTIMICPVGALTSQVYRFRARPWDNDATPSTCPLCPVGCSLILDARDGEIVRTRSRENKAVNDIWLCDKGWFGYEHTSHPDRLKTPLIRKNGSLTPSSWDEALTLIAKKLEEFKGGGQIAAWGGNPLTTEENFLFQKLFREGLKTNHLDHRIGMPLFTIEEEGMAAGMGQPIAEIETLDFAYILGLDITEEFPVLWLRLKQAMNCGAKVFFAGHYAPEIAPHLSQVHLHPPGKEIETIQELLKAEPGKKGAIFVGRQYLAMPNRNSIIAEILKTPLPLNIMEGQENSLGARLAGMYPENGLNYLNVLEKASRDGWDLLYIAGANPAAKTPSQLWQGALSKLKFLVVQDIFLSETAQNAHVVLPTLTYVEKGGSTINIERKAQKLLPGKEIPANILSDGEIFKALAKHLKVEIHLDPLPEITARKFKAKATISEVTGALKATFAPSLFDRGMRMKHNTHLVQLVKEPRLRIHPFEAAKRGFSNGEKVQVKGNGGTISGALKMDPKVAIETVVIPLGFETLKPYELGGNLLNGLTVEITKGTL